LGKYIIPQNWLCARVYARILSGITHLKDNTVAEKKLTDLKDFIASVNKKDKKRNGKKINFAFVNRKRK
jgi:hypothetical protein